MGSSCIICNNSMADEITLHYTSDGWDTPFRVCLCRGVLRLDASNLLSIPPFLRLPASSESQRTGHNRRGCVGVEAGDHCIASHSLLFR